MTDLRKAAEMALEFVEWFGSNDHSIRPKHKAPEIAEALRQALAQPEQEPVAWVYNGILHEFDPSEFATSEVTPLYTAPPKREWVGLTDEEIEHCFVFDWSGEFYANWRKQTYEAIKAKLKEKNT